MLVVGGKPPCAQPRALCGLGIERPPLRGHPATPRGLDRAMCMRLNDKIDDFTGYVNGFSNGFPFYLPRHGWDV